MYKLFLAWRYLISRPIIFLAVGGIAVGVMALIVVTSVMGGFSREMRDRIRGTSAHLNVTPANDYFIYDFPQLIEQIKTSSSVFACSPRLEWGALLGNGLHFVQFIGIEPDLEKEVNNYEKYLTKDTALNFPEILSDGTVPAISGARLYLSQGQTFHLTTLRLKSGLPSPVRQEFRVIGTFNSGMAEYDGNIYIPLKSAQDLLAAPSAVSKICIAIKDYRNVDAVREEIKKLLGPIGFFYVRTWEEEKQNLLRAVATEKAINAFLLFFIVVVAAFNILSLLTMRVVEKTKDIGIITSLGATPYGILWLFLWQGLLIAIIGSIIGVILGHTIAANLNPIEDFIYHNTGWKLFPPDIYYLDKIPSEINYSTIVIIVIATILVSILFSIYPAIKASRLKIVEALRYE
jgi:lipoprotein-releasing system permease protein